MRKFWLENETGEQLSLQSDSIFLYFPEGLGWNSDAEFGTPNNGFFVATQYQTEQPNILGTLLFRGEAYQNYESFLAWVNNANKLNMIYSPYDGKKLSAEVVLQYIEKSDLRPGGVLECPVSFLAKTPWSAQQPLVYKFTGGGDSNMRFTFRFPFRFGTAGQGGSLEATIGGQYPPGLVLIANGQISRPNLTVTEKYTGVVAGVLDMPGTSIAEGDQLQYTNTPGEASIYKVSGETKTSLIDELDITNNAFFALSPGVPYVFTFSADTSSPQTTHTLYIYEYYKG